MKLKERQYNVMIVSAQPKFNESVTSMMNERRHYQYEIRQSVSAAKRSLNDAPCDILIVNAPLPDEDGVQLAIDRSSSGSCVVMLVIKSEYYAEIFERVSTHGIFTLAKPSSRQLVTQAFDWLESASEKLSKLKKKSVSLEDKMQEIRIVNRAKWVLISDKGMTEEQAHRAIEKLAMDRCITKKAVAEEIIASNGE